MGVADQHDLDPASLGVVEEPGELAGADHSGLIDDQDVTAVAQWTWTAVAVLPVQFTEEPCECGGGDPGGVLEFGGRAGGERHPRDGDVSGLPGFASCVECEGLAGSGLADDNRNAVPLAGQPTDEVGLLPGQRGPSGDHRIDLGCAEPEPVVTSGDGAVGSGLFELEQLRRGEPHVLS